MKSQKDLEEMSDERYNDGFSIGQNRAKLGFIDGYSQCQSDMRTIVLYPGSFAPLHIGHINIVEKSERIFGKGNVIIAIGINPDKVSEERRESYIAEKTKEAKLISDKIGREVIVYSGFLHELVESYESQGTVVVVRGLRNGDDLDYEVNQLRFVNDFKKNVNVVYITCDKEFEHISSSAVRKIEEFGGSDMIKQYII